MKALPYLLAVLVLGAGALAFFRTERPPEPAPGPSETAAATATNPPDEPAHEAPAAGPMTAPPPATATAHGANGANGGDGPRGVENEEAPALTWTVPAGWRQAPNPNPMRLATYRIGSGGDDGPEVSVARAGGSADANIERWVHQFQDASTPKRTEKKVRGIDVTVLEVGGTYGGGIMMPGAAAASHPGWTLVGAIAQPPDGSTYFFKLIGPSGPVHAARASFDALLASLAPAASL